MKNLLLFSWLFITSYVSRGQTYNPTNFTISNKAYGIAQAVPTDARSYFYDASLFIQRPYQSTAEVLSYLNLTKYRAGNFPIYVSSGTLQSGGTFSGGTISEYWFKNGTSNASLVLKTGVDTLSVTFFGYNISDTISDQTSILQAAVNYVGSRGGGAITFPTGVYNAGMNNIWSNIHFIMNGVVKVKKVWHFAVGRGPNISSSDPNYQLNPVYVENCRIIGGVEFTDGGRLGTFYSKNCGADLVKLSRNHDGVHIYSNTENFSIGEIYSESGRHDAGNSGAVFIDKVGDSSAVPKNIHIGKMYVNGAYFHALFLTVKGFTLDEIIVKKSGLSGIRIEDCEDVHIGSVSVDSCGYFSTPYDFIRTGVTVGGISKNIIIDNLKATGNNSYQLMVYNPNSTDVHFLNVETGNSDSSAVYIKDVKRVSFNRVKSYNAPYALEIDNAKDVKIDYADLYNASKNALVIKSAFDQLKFGTLFLHDNAENGVAIGGSGKIAIDNIISFKNRLDHIFLVGFSGELRVGKITAGGAGTLSYYSALSLQGVTGRTVVDEITVDSFVNVGSKGIYGYNNSGETIINSVQIKNSSVGIDIDASHNSGFKIGSVKYNNVTTNRTAYPPSTLSNYVGADTIPPVVGVFAQGDRWKNSGYAFGMPSEWVYDITGSWLPIGRIGGVKLGASTLIGDSITTAFVVTHNLGHVPTSVIYTPTSLFAAGKYFISSKTTTTFIVNYETAPTSSDVVTFDWEVK